MAISCKVVTLEQLRGEVYKSQDHPMVGEIELRLLSDKTFMLNERSGMLHSVGYWKISDDGNSIILNSDWRLNNSTKPNDSTLNFRVKDERIKIINRHKLEYKKIILVASK